MASVGDKRYAKEIKPLLSELKLRCRRMKVPFFFCVCIDPEADDWRAEMISPFQSGIREMGHDYIAEHVKIANGYVAVLPEDNRVDMEDFSSVIEAWSDGGDADGGE